MPSAEDRFIPASRAKQLMVLLIMLTSLAGDVFGETKTRQAYGLNEQALVLLQEGELDSATALAEQAVERAERDLGADHPGVVAALANLGEIHAATGRFGKAEPTMLRALELAENSWGIGPVDLGAVLNNLGKLNAELGRYAEAEAYYRRALDQAERIGKAHLAVATWLNNLAALYVRQNRPAEAWPLYERSMTLLSDRVSHRDSAIQETFNAMGTLALGEGKLKVAEQFLAWSLGIRREAYGDEHPVTAVSLHNLGLLRQQQGRPEEAGKLLMQAYRIREARLPSDHPEVGISLFGLAQHFDRLEDRPQAKHFYLAAMQNLLARFRSGFGFMSESDRLDFLDTVDTWFPAFYSFGARHHAQDRSLSGEMYDLLLVHKGMIAASVEALQAAIRAENDPTTLAMFEQLQSLRSLIAQQRHQQREHPKLQARINELERQLARHSGTFSRRQDTARPTWQSVRETLQAGEAAVDYLVFDNFDGKRWTGNRLYAALVLTPADTWPRLVMLGDAEKLSGPPFTDYRQRAGLERDPTLENKPGFLQAFWDPLSDALRNAKRIFVAPAGLLHQVAWGVVGDDSGKLLIEQVELRLLSTTRDLVSQPRTFPRSRHAAVLLGAPDYRTGSGVAADDTPPGDTPLVFEPLPGTRSEVETIQRLLGEADWPVTLFLDESASESNLQQIHNPRVLHLATHGFFETPGTQQDSDQTPGPRIDPMLRAGLALAGADQAESGASSNGSDGILTALEASTLDLRGTELVILSACETGLGTVRAGEGVFGLQRAFQQAGADAVLMSLWRVPDDETRELMVNFYRFWLSGMDKHLALRKAQLQLRRAIQERFGRDRPQRWGGFILVGR